MREKAGGHERDTVWQVRRLLHCWRGTSADGSSARVMKRQCPRLKRGGGGGGRDRHSPLDCLAHNGHEARGRHHGDLQPIGTKQPAGWHRHVSCCCYCCTLTVHSVLGAATQACLDCPCSAACTRCQAPKQAVPAAPACALMLDPLSCMPAVPSPSSRPPLLKAPLLLGRLPGLLSASPCCCWPHTGPARRCRSCLSAAPCGHSAQGPPDAAAAAPVATADTVPPPAAAAAAAADFYA